MADRFGCLINMKFPSEVFVNDNTKQFVRIHICQFSIITFWYVVTNITLVLSQLIAILLSFHHLLTLAISEINLTSRFFLLSSHWHPMWSRQHSYLVTSPHGVANHSWRLWRAKGQVYSPWGTPCVTGLVSEICSLNWTHCSLFCKYDFSQSIVFLLHWYIDSFLRRMSVSNKSKAFLKSNNIIPF